MKKENKAKNLEEKLIADPANLVENIKRNSSFHRRHRIRQRSFASDFASELLCDVWWIDDCCRCASESPHFQRQRFFCR